MSSCSSSSDVGVPLATTSPSRRTVTSSATDRTSSSWWLTSSTDPPRPATSRISAWKCSRESRGRAREDSSNMISPLPGWWCCRARAIATVARSAGSRSPTFAFGSISWPRCRSASRASWHSPSQRIERLRRRRRKAPIRTFSTTLKSSRRPRSWCTTDMPSRCSSAGRTGSPTGAPSTSTWPPGSGAWYPESSFTSVDFPDPFCPTSPWISPG